jgi:hypothetical protein
VDVCHSLTAPSPPTETIAWPSGLKASADTTAPLRTGRRGLPRDDPDQWTLSSEIEWQARSGSTFTTRCELPHEWEIIDVRSSPDESASPLINWDVTRSADGVRRLNLEFFDAVAPDSPKTVRVLARRGAAPPGAPIAMPVVRPLDCGSVELLLAVSHPQSLLPLLERAGSFEAVTDSDLPAFAEQSPLWNEFLVARHGPSLIVYSNVPRAAGNLVLENIEPPVDARVRMTVEVDADRITESLVAEFDPQKPVDRVFVYLNRETGDVPLTWELADEGAVRLRPRRVPASRHGEWGLPSEGELWEVRLPEPETGEFRIAARRNRGPGSTETPLLAFIPGTRTFRGLVELRAAEGRHVEVETAGLQPLEPDAGQAERPAPVAGLHPGGRVWRYRTAADRLTLRMREEPAAPALPPLASLALHSRLSPAGAGDDVRRATFHVAADTGTGEFRFELPETAIVMAVRMNGEPVHPSRDGSAFSLPALPAGSANVVEVVYRAASSGGLLCEMRDVPVPRTAHTILHFEWELALPPEARLAGEPYGVVLHAPPAGPSWTRRLFGALGRPAKESVFHPFSPDAWRDLLWPDEVRASEAHEFAAFEEGSEVPAGWTMLHFVWVGAAVWLIGCAGRMLLRRCRANVRYLFALACFTALTVAPPAIATWVLRSAAGEGEIARMQVPPDAAVGRIVNPSDNRKQDEALEHPRI